MSVRVILAVILAVAINLPALAVWRKPEIPSAGTDSTKYLKSDGANGWTLGTPAGGVTSLTGGGGVTVSGSTGAVTLGTSGLAASGANSDITSLSGLNGIRYNSPTYYDGQTLAAPYGFVQIGGGGTSVVYVPAITADGQVLTLVAHATTTAVLGSPAGNKFDLQSTYTLNPSESVTFISYAGSGGHWVLAGHNCITGGSAPKLSVARGGTGAADAATARSNLSAAAVTAAGAFDCGSTITTVSGSTSGDLHWTMPVNGASYKKCIIVLDAFKGSGTTINFTSAFGHTPALTSNNTSLSISTLSTSQIVIPDTAGSAITGVLTVEGI